MITCTLGRNWALVFIHFISIWAHSNIFDIVWVDSSLSDCFSKHDLIKFFLFAQCSQSEDYLWCQHETCHSTDPYDYIYYIDGIILFSVAIFGIIGTIMSMVVLLKPQSRDLFSKFLTALCVFDCIFLIMAIFYIALPSMSCW